MAGDGRFWMKRRYLLACALGAAACSVVVDPPAQGDPIEPPVEQSIEPQVPCTTVAIDAPIHATSLQAGLVASVVAPKPGGYFWELDDSSLGCQAAIRAGQGTPAITFDAGFAGCTMKLRATDAQSCTGTRRVQTDFLDVTLFHPFIDRVVGNDALRGCGGGRFCPDDPTLRQEMARILLRARAVSGGNPDYQPPACVPTSQRVFNDVPFTNPYCPWIEQLAQAQITSGCGNGAYCPLSTVTRAQMAVFLLVAREGPGYTPAACVPGQEMFADVPAASPFCRWIEELARRGITAGCGGSPANYCPEAPVTRGQMAVFVDQTFGLVFP
jgi:hypothetical protein